MNTPRLVSWMALSACVAWSAAALDLAAWNHNWPQWRGPLGSGFAPTATPPLEWSETNNLKWKVEIPGSGLATPIVWENNVFILTAIPTGRKVAREGAEQPTEQSQSGSRRGIPKPDEIHQFVVLCLDRGNGRILWKRVAREEVPHEGHHPDHGYASASPATDGERLLAYFGSRGLYCYDLDGTPKWDVDFGDMNIRNGFGEGSSPALYGDMVVVLWDHEGDDFLVAVDKNSGEERWRTPRNEGTAWTTPVITEVNGEAQVIVAGTSAIRGYDLATGKEIWNGPGLTANVIPTPIVADGVLYAMSGFRGASVQVIKLGARGNVAGTDSILWSYDRNTPYVPSPVLVDGCLYFGSNNNAILSCLDAASGRAHFLAERLEGIKGMYASLVAAGNHVYALGHDGVCLVLKTGPQLEIVAANKLNDKTNASMALAGNDVFIRGSESLYCIAAE